MSRSPNFCLGPYGAVYDYVIERQGLMCAIARAVWGVDLSVLYSSMEAIGRASHGATILDVPCGGGVAFRALRPDQDVRYIAVDISEDMLARARQRAKMRSLSQIEFAVADMCALPFADDEADLFVSYSGLHMLVNPERAVREMLRRLKPGGELVGTTLLSEAGLRQRTLFRIGRHRGYATPPSGPNLRRWLAAGGIVEPVIEPQRGFAVFRGHKRAPRRARKVSRTRAPFAQTNRSGACAPRVSSGHASR